jgi:hypothetical protein
MAKNLVEYVLDIKTKAAEQGLDDVTKELEQLIKELEKADRKGKKSFDETQKSTKKTNEKLKQTQRQTTATQRALTKIGKVRVVWGKIQFAIAGVVAALGSFAVAFKVIKRVTDLTNELNDLSVRSGLAANTIQGLRQALIASGQPAEGLNEILGAISNQFAQLSMEGSSVEKKFSAFGIAVKDTSGKLRSNNEILLDGIKKLQGISDSSERSRAAVTLFGEAGAKLNQALAAGNFENFIMFTERFGIKTGPEASKAAAQLQLSMSLLNTVFDGTLQKIVNATDGQNRFIQGMIKLGSTAAFVGSLVDSFSNEINDLTGVLQDLVVFGIKNFLFALGPFGIAMRIQIALAETLAGQFFDVNKAIADLTGSVYNSIDPTNRLGSALEKAKSESAEFEKRTKMMLSSLDGLSDATGAASSQMDNLSKSTEKTTEKIRTLIDVVNDLLDRFVSFNITKFVSDFAIGFAAIDQIINKSFDGSRIDLFANTLRKKLLDTVSLADVDLGGTGEIIIEATKFTRFEEFLNKMKLGVTEIFSIAVKGLGQSVSRLSGALSKGLAGGAALAVTGVLAVLKIAEGLGQRGSTVAEIEKSVEEDIRARAKAIELGLRALPRILFQVLPPLFVEFADRVVFGLFKGLAEFVKQIIDGIKSIFTREGRQNIGKNIKEGLKEGFEEFFRRVNVVGGILSGGSKRGGGPFIPSARGGIKFTGADEGLAMLHRGEFVVPETGQMPQAVQRTMGMGQGGMTININAAVVESNAVDELVRQIERRFQTFGSSTSPLFGGR